MLDDGTVVQVLGYGDCLKNYGDKASLLENMYEVYFQSKKHAWYVDSVATKFLTSVDSTTREEFRKDCALENGTLAHSDFPYVVCLVKYNKKPAPKLERASQNNKLFDLLDVY